MQTFVFAHKPPLPSQELFPSPPPNMNAWPWEAWAEMTSLTSVSIAIYTHIYIYIYIVIHTHIYIYINSMNNTVRKAPHLALSIACFAPCISVCSAWPRHVRGSKRTINTWLQLPKKRQRHSMWLCLIFFPIIYIYRRSYIFPSNKSSKRNTTGHKLPVPMTDGLGVRCSLPWPVSELGLLIYICLCIFK